MIDLKYTRPQALATYETPKLTYRIIFLPSRKGKGEVIWVIHEDVSFKLVDQGVAKNFSEAEARVKEVLSGGAKATPAATKKARVTTKGRKKA